MHTSRIGMDLVTLHGCLADKLTAVKQAGFSQVMLKGSDLAAAPGGLRAGVNQLLQSGLRCTGLQVLRDFEGVSGRFRAFKSTIAKEMLALCTAVNSPVLLACSATGRHASSDVRDIVRDLRLLATMADDYGVRIAYEALSWGCTVRTSELAWSLISDANHDNLGIALDSFHHIATQSSLEALVGLVPEKIFLVQLADFLCPTLQSDAERIATARHHRVFPGEGAHDMELGAFVATLNRIGYRGDYSLEVFNDDYWQLPSTFVAERARQSRLWISRQTDPGFASKLSCAA